MLARRTLSLLLALSSLAAIGCTTTNPSEPNDPPVEECHDASTPGCVVSSALSRDTSPSVAQPDLAAVAEGNTQLALDLYQQLRAAPGNFFYSPYSISSALAMTWAGARTQTEQDMAAALHFTLPQDRLHPAFNAVDLALESRGQGAAGADGQGFRLNVANALWGQIDYELQASFLDVLAESYGAGMHVVDFAGAPDQSMDLINGWVSDATEGKIEKLLAPENINPSTKLILTNAVYFNAAWENPFEESSTQDAAFTTQAGAVVQVPTMRGSASMPFSEGPGYKAVELPYDGNELGMVIILPENLDTFEQGLDAARLKEVVDGLELASVDTYLPRFKFKSRFGLKDALSTLGMGVAFSDEADFDGIRPASKLRISDVVHEAFIGVNEAGTEAAAATAVIVGDGSAPEFKEINLDRPFLFLIRDIETSTVLFVGRVSDPSAL